MDASLSPQPLWTAADIAAYTQLNPGTIRNMQSKRELPDPIRIGRSVRWNPSEVIAFFAGKQAA
jgi:predicted DNA-binding transcriptional regulator AlpA